MSLRLTQITIFKDFRQEKQKYTQPVFLIFRKTYHLTFSRLTGLIIAAIGIYDSAGKKAHLKKITIRNFPLSRELFFKTSARNIKVQSLV